MYERHTVPLCECLCDSVFMCLLVCLHVSVVCMRESICKCESVCVHVSVCVCLMYVWWSFSGNKASKSQAVGPGVFCPSDSEEFK